MTKYMAKEVSRSSLFFLVFRDLSNFTGATRCYPLNIYPLKKKLDPCPNIVVSFVICS